MAVSRPSDNARKVIQPTNEQWPHSRLNYRTPAEFARETSCGKWGQVMGGCDAHTAPVQIQVDRIEHLPAYILRFEEMTKVVPRNQYIATPLRA